MCNKHGAPVKPSQNPFAIRCTRISYWNDFIRYNLNRYVCSCGACMQADSFLSQIYAIEISFRLHYFTLKWLCDKVKSYYSTNFVIGIDAHMELVTFALICDIDSYVFCYLYYFCCSYRCFLLCATVTAATAAAASTSCTFK